MNKEIECDYTNEIVCPYCGEEAGDSWETSKDMSNGESATCECQACDKKFNVSVDIDITYNSWKLEDK